MIVEYYNTFQGYEIKALYHSRWYYLSGVYSGKYKFSSDYTYAKHYKTLRAVKRHEKAIENLTKKQYQIQRKI